MKLPTEKTKARRSVDCVSMLLYGAPKIGKSTFCSRFDNALFLACEPGLSYLETFNVNISSWKDFLDALKELEKGCDFKTIIIDTVDQMWAYCVRALLDAYKIQFVGDLAFGKGYALIEGEFQKAIMRLMALRKGVVFISHATFAELDTPQGKIKKIVPSIPERARNVVMPLVDVIGYAASGVSIDSSGNAVEQRVLRTQPGAFWEAGDRSGRLPEMIPFKFAAFKYYFEAQEEK